MTKPEALARAIEARLALPWSTSSSGWRFAGAWRPARRPSPFTIPISAVPPSPPSSRAPWRTRAASPGVWRTSAAGWW